VRGAHSLWEPRRRGGQLRGPRRNRKAAPGGGAGVLSLPALADRRSAYGGPLRPALPRQGRDLVGSVRTRGRASLEQRAGGVLLPPRPRLHVHARAGPRGAGRAADVLRLRDGRAAAVGRVGASPRRLADELVGARGTSGDRSLSLL